MTLPSCSCTQKNGHWAKRVTMWISTLYKKSLSSGKNTERNTHNDTQLSAISVPTFIYSVTDGRVVRAGVSVIWNVLSWSGGHEFETRSGQSWGAWYFCPKLYLNQKCWSDELSWPRRSALSDIVLFWSKCFHGDFWTFSTTKYRAKMTANSHKYLK